MYLRIQKHLLVSTTGDLRKTIGKTKTQKIEQGKGGKEESLRQKS